MTIGDLVQSQTPLPTRPSGARRPSAVRHFFRNSGAKPRSDQEHQASGRGAEPRRPPPPPLFDEGSYWADPRYGTTQVDPIHTYASGAAVTFGGALLTGPNAASYTIVSNTCAGTPVPSGVGCQISVQLHATTIGPLLEATKLMASLTLPKSPYLATLAVSLEP